MSKKSRMVREGNAKRKADMAQRKAQQDAELLQKAMAPLRVSDFVSANLKGLIPKDDLVLPTIEEIKAGKADVPLKAGESVELAYLRNPAKLGKANLMWLYAVWREELLETDKEVTRMEGRLKTCGGKTPAGVIPKLKEMTIRKMRLARVLEYIKGLLLMADDKPLLPGFHALERFKPGSAVLCYIPDVGFFRSEVQCKFMMGVVVDDAEEKWRMDMPTVDFGEQVTNWMCDRSFNKVQFHPSNWCILEPEDYKYLMGDDQYRELWLCMLMANENNKKCRWTDKLYWSFREGQEVIDRWRAETGMS